MSEGPAQFGSILRTYLLKVFIPQKKTKILHIRPAYSYISKITIHVLDVWKFHITMNFRLNHLSIKTTTHLIRHLTLETKTNQANNQ